MPALLLLAGSKGQGGAHHVVPRPGDSKVYQDLARHSKVQARPKSQRPSVRFTVLCCTLPHAKHLAGAQGNQAKEITLVAFVKHGARGKKHAARKSG